MSNCGGGEAGGGGGGGDGDGGGGGGQDPDGSGQSQSLMGDNVELGDTDCTYHTNGNNHNGNGIPTTTKITVTSPMLEAKAEAHGFANLIYEEAPNGGVKLTVANGTAINRAGSVISEISDESDVPTEGEKTTYLQTLMHLLNGFVGSGILSMPMAFKDGGIVLASALNPVIGIMSLYCIHQLLSINRFAMKRTNSPVPFNYHELAMYAFHYGPRGLRRYDKLARRLVLAAIVITQIGACCVYFTFIATNLEKFLSSVLDEQHVPSKEACLALVLPFVVAINWIRNIRHLTLFSTISNGAQLCGMGIILYNLFSRPLEDIKRLPKVGNKLPQFFVSTLFIYEGISVSMSLYRAIRDPRDFHKPLGVLNVGLGIIIAVYFSIGFFGYVQYGEAIQSTITVNLPALPLYDIVQLLYTTAVLLTYPIILYVPIQTLWPHMRIRAAAWLRVASITPDHKNGLGLDRVKIIGLELAFRTGLVCLTYILAAGIPKLELLLALVGSVTSSTIAITIPAILHLVAFWNQRKGTSRAILLISNLILLVIGLAGLVFGFYYSLLDIIDSYSQPASEETSYQVDFTSMT